MAEVRLSAKFSDDLEVTMVETRLRAVHSFSLIFSELQKINVIV